MSCGVELYGKILLENGVLPFVSFLIQRMSCSSFDEIIAILLLSKKETFDKTTFV